MGREKKCEKTDCRNVFSVHIDFTCWCTPGERGLHLIKCMIGPHV